MFFWGRHTVAPIPYQDRHASIHVGLFLRVEAWKFQAYEKGPTSQSDLP